MCHVEIPFLYPDVFLCPHLSFSVMCDPWGWWGLGSTTEKMGSTSSLTWRSYSVLFSDLGPL